MIWLVVLNFAIGQLRSSLIDDRRDIPLPLLLLKAHALFNSFGDSQLTLERDTGCRQLLSSNLLRVCYNRQSSRVSLGADKQ